jgi:hypothetical protein
LPVADRRRKSDDVFVYIAFNSLSRRMADIFSTGREIDREQLSNAQ